MIILGCWSGYNLYLQFNPFKLTISFVLQVFIYGLLFVGLIFGFYGMLSEKNVRMKTGFLCFWVGCISLLIKVIIGIFYEGINFRCLFELLLSLFFPPYCISCTGGILSQLRLVRSCYFLRIIISPSGRLLSVSKKNEKMGNISSSAFLLQAL